jgi:3-hydroxyacyl-CoA dehydrogenase/enoyl-CoA hydratase/3-hydroxybutyryl-CoA epimerase
MKDGPGFLVNRLLLPYLNEAVYLLEEGYSAEDIDKAFLKFGMPMGPLHLIDEVGIDVGVKVAKIFHKAFGERAAPSKTMVRIAETGRLGKKNKKGFYLYDDRGYKLNLDQTVYKDLGLPQPTKKLDPKIGVDRGVFAMVNEAALAFLEDRIVETPQDVDMCMIMGTGFPPFRGGLLRYADSIGSEKIVDSLEEFAVKFGPRFKPSNPLKQMAKTNRKFYS